MKEMQCQLKAIRQDWLSKQVHGKVHHILPMCFHHSPSSHPFPISFPVLFQHLMWFPYLFPYLICSMVFYIFQHRSSSKNNKTHMFHMFPYSICFHGFPHDFWTVPMAPCSSARRSMASPAVSGVAETSVFGGSFGVGGTCTEPLEVIRAEKIISLWDSIWYIYILCTIVYFMYNYICYVKLYILCIIKYVSLYMYV